MIVYKANDFLLRQRIQTSISDGVHWHDLLAIHTMSLLELHFYLSCGFEECFDLSFRKIFLRVCVCFLFLSLKKLDFVLLDWI